MSLHQHMNTLYPENDLEHKRIKPIATAAAVRYIKTTKEEIKWQ